MWGRYMCRYLQNMKPRRPSPPKTPRIHIVSYCYAQTDGTIRRRFFGVGGARGRGDGAAGADDGREGCAKFFFLGCSNESISNTSSTVCRPQLGFWITRKLGLESGQVKDIMHLNFQMSRTITATVRLPLPNDYCYRTSTATERVPLTRLRHRLSPY